MQAAMEMLRDGQPVKCVALELCYEGSCQFCREFRHYFGLSPREAVQQAVNTHAQNVVFGTFNIVPSSANAR